MALRRSFSASFKTFTRPISTISRGKILWNSQDCSSENTSVRWYEFCIRVETKLCYDRAQLLTIYILFTKSMCIRSFFLKAGTFWQVVHTFLQLRYRLCLRPCFQTRMELFCSGYGYRHYSAENDQRKRSHSKTLSRVERFGNDAFWKRCFLVWTEKTTLSENGDVIKIDTTGRQTTRPWLSKMADRRCI